MAEIEKHNVIDRAAELFSELNIVSKGKKVIDNLEWRAQNSATVDDEYVDSDDDEDDIDPLKIIAQSRDNVKRVKIIKPEPTLITENDLKEIESFQVEIVEGTVSSKHTSAQILPDSTASTISRTPSELSISAAAPELDPHVNYLCSKEHDALPPPLKYKPYYTTTSNSSDPLKEKFRHKPHKWEVTAATPPDFQHQEAKVLTLHESIALQILQQDQMKEIKEKQAVERLMAKDNRLVVEMSCIIPESSASFKTFRTPKTESSDDSNGSSGSDSEDDEEAWEDQAVHDDVGPVDGGVTIVQYE